MVAINSKVDPDGVKILSKEILLQGFCHIERSTMQHRTFAGDWTPIYTRDFMIKPPVAAALPYDPVLDQIVLIEQFRVGALGQIATPWMIEIVAGIMDQDYAESLEDLIHREMLEEACLEIKTLIPIYEYLVSPGCSTEKVKLFCALVDSSKVPKYCGLAEEHEDIKIHVVSSQEAFRAVRLGQICNAVSIIALQWLELNIAQYR